MTSSNQDIKTNVEEECEVHVLSFVVCVLSKFALKKIMPSSRCVVLIG